MYGFLWVRDDGWYAVRPRKLECPFRDPRAHRRTKAGMELRQLRQLVTLAETLNFHRAAERLHMAQPPLSTSIRKLEEELGVQLFERRPGALQVTPAGEIVLRHARRTLACADEIRRSARECATGEQGLLRVGFVGTATYSLLPRIIPVFRQRHPNVQLVLSESTTTELLRALDKREIDVALLRTPVFEPCRAAVTLLEHDRWMIAVHADSPLATHERLALAELGGEPFIVNSRATVPAMHTMTMLAFDHAGISPEIVQEVVQVQTMLSLVESGLGVAMVPSVAQRYASRHVRLLPLTDLPDTLAVGIAMAIDPEAPSAPARRFAEVATELIPDARAARRG